MLGLIKEFWLWSRSCLRDARRTKRFHVRQGRTRTLLASSVILGDEKKHKVVALQGIYLEENIWGLSDNRNKKKKEAFSKFTDAGLTQFAKFLVISSRPRTGQERENFFHSGMHCTNKPFWLKFKILHIEFYQDFPWFDLQATDECLPGWKVKAVLLLCAEYLSIVIFNHKTMFICDWKFLFKLNKETVNGDKRLSISNSSQRSEVNWKHSFVYATICTHQLWLEYPFQEANLLFKLIAFSVYQGLKLISLRLSRRRNRQERQCIWAFELKIILVAIWDKADKEDSCERFYKFMECW